MIKVRLTQGKSASLRSANIVLEWKRFIKLLVEQIIDGFSVYAVPALCIPISIRMICGAREAVSEDLGTIATGIIRHLSFGIIDTESTAEHGTVNGYHQKNTPSLV